MNVNDKHIERYIIQYFEGNLSPTEKEWLLHIVQQNEYYGELFELYKQMFLLPQEISYPKKDILKKNSNQYIINEWEDRCIRYIEKELTPEEEKTFLKELESDNEKRNIFEQYRYTRLIAQSNENALFKNKLKKNNSLFNSFEELCIQSVENIISESDKKKLEQLLQNDAENRKVFEQYSNTKLKPDTTLTYPYKHRLKKTVWNKTVWFYWTSVAAASIIILFFWLNQRQETKYSLQAHYNISQQMFYKKPANKQMKQPSKREIFTQQSIRKTPEPVLSDEMYSEQSVAQIQIHSVDSNTNPFFVEKTIVVDNTDTIQFDDIVLKESLDKLFANHRYHFLHIMIEQPDDLNHHYQTNRGGALWKILQKGSKYLNYTGASIKINEYHQRNRIKKEIVIGSLYFSKSSQK